MALQFLSAFTANLFTYSFPTPPDQTIHYVITTISLGYIGYSIGAHLDVRKLRETSWGLPIILLGEVFGAFAVVTIFVFIFSQNFILSILLGAIAMATAPASTSEVIKEYNAYGSLSQTILFIIAFDDIIAILFFNIALSYSESIFLGVRLSLISILMPIIIEVLGSIILGVLLAILMKLLHIEGIQAY